MEDMMDFEGLTKERTSGTRQAREQFVSRFERQRSVIFVEGMHSFRSNDEVALDLEETFKKPETEKRSSIGNSQEIQLTPSSKQFRENEDNKTQSIKRFELSPSESISSDSNERNEVNIVAALEIGIKDVKSKINPFQIVYKMRERLSVIRNTNRKHQSIETASKYMELDLSKYVDDIWDLDEQKIGLFPDDDYALTYRDNQDTLPAIFEDDGRFVMIDGLIQLIPESEPIFSVPFMRKSIYGATAQKGQIMWK